MTFRQALGCFPAVTFHKVAAVHPSPEFEMGKVLVKKRSPASVGIYQADLVLRVFVKRSDKGYARHPLVGANKAVSVLVRTSMQETERRQVTPASIDCWLQEVAEIFPIFKDFPRRELPNPPAMRHCLTTARNIFDVHIRQDV